MPLILPLMRCHRETMEMLRSRFQVSGCVPDEAVRGRQRGQELTLHLSRPQFRATPGSFSTVFLNRVLDLEGCGCPRPTGPSH
jgi:hypothetical protein